MEQRPVVLVTGASRGIGREIALTFAKKKYRVGINFLKSSDRAKKVAAEVKAAGGEPFLLEADISNSSQVKGMTAGLVKKWGRIDVLINNAGITRDRSILKMSDEEWNEVVNTNLTGAFWCLRECAGKMIRQRDGAILNISSIVAVRGSVGNANYAAAKAGLIALTKAAARELGRFDVRVNCVLPGFHRTDMGKTVWEKDEERVRSEHVLGRLTDIRELCEFVVFLARRKSVSGQIYNFDSRVL